MGRLLHDPGQFDASPALIPAALARVFIPTDWLRARLRHTTPCPSQQQVPRATLAACKLVPVDWTTAQQPAFNTHPGSMRAQKLWQKQVPSAFAVKRAVHLHSTWQHWQHWLPCQHIKRSPACTLIRQLWLPTVRYAKSSSYQQVKQSRQGKLGPRTLSRLKFYDGWVGLITFCHPKR